jgi:multidrug efflux pump subunit AcrB
MTSLAAILGMLPLALAIGAGADMLQPLAIAVIGGLAVALLLSLVVTPTVYAMVTRDHRRPGGDARHGLDRDLQRGSENWE